MKAKLGIIAGGGELPRRLIAAVRAENRPHFVLALDGQADAATASDVEHAWIRLGQGGTGLDLLRQAGVRELVIAGSVKRPSLGELRPDWRTIQFFAKLGRRAFGDNGLLGALVKELEAEGFRVVAPDSLLGDLLAPKGPLGRILPDAEAEADIARGVEVARALGALDIGQAVIVQQGVVLGVEAAEGTDGLVRRCGPLKLAGPGGVLVKTSKPGQERRIDLPTIGAATVAAAAAAGLRGIAVEAGNAHVIDRAAVAAAADAAGLFIIGIDLPVDQPHGRP
jgi:hypothetical protein